MDRPGEPDSKGRVAPTVVLMPELIGPLAVLFEGVLYVKNATVNTRSMDVVREARAPSNTTDVV